MNIIIRGYIGNIKYKIFKYAPNKNNIAKEENIQNIQVYIIKCIARIKANIIEWNTYINIKDFISSYSNSWFIFILTNFNNSNNIYNLI